MKKAVYPGSFDPVTFGHLDIIERASEIFDVITIGVLKNQSKAPLFTVEERVEMLREVTSHLSNIQIESFEGLTVDFVKRCDANVLVRGLRAITDFEYEMQMAQTNRVMAQEIDTVFLITSLKYAYLSSTTVKEVAKFGGDITAFLPPYVEGKVFEKFEKK